MTQMRLTTFWLLCVFTTSPVTMCVAIGMALGSLAGSCQKRATCAKRKCPHGLRPAVVTKSIWSDRCMRIGEEAI